MPTINTNPIWVHAVSAGETIAAVPLIKRLLAHGHQVLVTTMTPTGRDRIVSLLGDDVEHFYAPYDLPDVVKRFLSATRPKAFVAIDTELWPNIIHYNHVGNIPSFLVNGRLSEKSARRYLKIQALSRPMMQKLTRVFAQTEAQGRRFKEIGVRDSRLLVTGSIKFDARLPENLEIRREELLKKFEGRKVFLAASTHEGEEDMVLQALQDIRQDQNPHLLIIAPRHPHRCDRVYELCLSKGITVVRHSENSAYGEDTLVYLLDTMGELIYFYSVAEIALVGGSLVDAGGHNPMEPASLGKPMIMGKYRRNIEYIADQFVAAGAMVLVEDVQELRKIWQRLSSERSSRAEMSRAALTVITQNRGALDQIEGLILDQID